MIFKIKDKDNLSRIVKLYKENFMKSEYSSNDVLFNKEIFNGSLIFSDERYFNSIYHEGLIKFEDGRSYKIVYNNLYGILNEYEDKYRYNIEYTDYNETDIIYMVLYIIHYVVRFIGKYGIYYKAKLGYDYLKNNESTISTGRFKFMTNEIINELIYQSDRFDEIVDNNGGNRFASPYIYYKDVYNKETKEKIRYYRVGKNYVYYTVDDIIFYKCEKSKMFYGNKYKATSLDKKYNIHFMVNNDVGYNCYNLVNIFIDETCRLLLSDEFDIYELFLLVPELVFHCNRYYSDNRYFNILYDTLYTIYRKLYIKYDIISFNINFKNRNKNYTEYYVRHSVYKYKNDEYKFDHFEYNRFII